MADSDKKKGGNPGRRAAQRIANMPERLERVDQMLRACWSHSAIADVCSREWGVSRRQVRKYVSKVYKRWEEDAQKTFVDRVALRRSQLEGVLEKAMTSRPPDLRVAVAALDRLCRIDGAYSPAEVRATVQATVEGSVSLQKMTSNDKRTELDRLIEEYGRMRQPVQGGSTEPN